MGKLLVFTDLWWIFLLAIFVIGCKSSCGLAASDTDPMLYPEQRKKMVEEQIMSRGILDQKVLNALLKVERHLFVPNTIRTFAYSDQALPIGEGQTISQPYIVAYMTYALKLKKSDKILEIGTGSGYQAAILGELCNKVYTIEINETLGNRSKKLLKKIGYKNIEVKVGDGYKGWKEHAPFDAIIVTCAPTHIPEPLKEQLAEGGKMIIPVGGRGFQRLILLRKKMANSKKNMFFRYCLCQ